MLTQLAPYNPYKGFTSKLNPLCNSTPSSTIWLRFPPLCGGSFVKFKVVQLQFKFQFVSKWLIAKTKGLHSQPLRFVVTALNDRNGPGTFPGCLTCRRVRWHRKDRTSHARSRRRSDSDTAVQMLPRAT